MKSRLIWCLVGVNIALAITLIAPRLRENSAMAQQRIDRPADYLMIPGEVGGADRGVVYIVDSSNGMMSAVAFEDSSGKIEVMPPTDLVRVFQDGQAGGRR